jgi:hypothetical protein
MGILLAFVVIAAACGGSGGQTVKTRTTGSSRPSTTSTTATGATTSTRAAPSAAHDLAPYFAAAGSVDQKLAAAAKRINGGIGTDAYTFDQATVDAVAAADPSRAAALIPAGLAPDLLRAVLVTESELVSRYSAMRTVQVGTFPVGQHEATETLRCLANGAGPAARFPADLEAARALARSAPPVTPVAADSRAAAELAIRLQDVVLRNRGCESCGGSVVTQLTPIAWAQQSFGPGTEPWDGTIGGVLFRATHDAAGWHVELNAC